MTKETDKSTSEETSVSGANRTNRKLYKCFRSILLPTLCTYLIKIYHNSHLSSNCTSTVIDP